jgi:HK97 family phage portal protein
MALALFRAERPRPVDRIPPTMGTKLFNASPENPSTSLSDPAPWLYEAFGGGSSFAGPVVNETTAMRSTAVYRCVALKAGVIASLPLKVYKRTKDGREEAVNHRLYPLLADNPSNLMSSFIWKELIVATLMMRGNHYSVIEYDNAARVTGLLPALGPVQVERIKGRNRYTFTFKDGATETYDQEDVIHVPGLGFDGVTGLSPIAWAGKQSIGNSLAGQEMMGRMYANGMKPSFAVTLPQKIDKANGVPRLRAELDDFNGGRVNVGRPLLLDHGTTVTQLQMTLQDSQTLETMSAGVADIARLFGVPPHMIGETSKTSSWGTGVEQQTTGFKIYNLEPDLSRIEGELNRKLFVHPYYCEFNRDAIVAMDAKTQSEIFASGFMNAQFTANDLRRMRNQPPSKDPRADELFVQAGTVPISMAGQQQQKPAPTPPSP